MTEKRVERERYPVDDLAFVFALVAAPLVVALFGFWALIPLGAVFFGAPTYLTFGAYGFYVALRNRDATASGVARVGLVAHLVSLPFALAVLLAFDVVDMWRMFAGLGVFGAIFAPLWGWVFGLIYRGVRRSRFRPTSHVPTAA